jgi:hypothetical protein
MRRAIAWWMSAPIDQKTAVLLVVGTWTLLAAVLLSLPPPHH